MNNSIFGNNANINAPVVATIKIADISADPDQPRKYFDKQALKDLATTIKEKGLIQPIIVRSNSEGGGYIIIAGERRFRAVQLNEAETIQAIVRDDLDHKAAALIENIQRQNLKPIEEAEAIATLIARDNLSQNDVASMIGVGRLTINQLLKIRTLPEQLQKESIDLDTPKSILIELARINDKKLVNRLWNKSKKDSLTIAEIRKVHDTAGKKKVTDEEPELSSQEKAIRKAFDALESLKDKPLSEAERARLMELQAKILGMLE